MKSKLNNTPQNEGIKQSHYLSKGRHNKNRVSVPQKVTHDLSRAPEVCYLVTLKQCVNQKTLPEKPSETLSQNE